jgi:hypothetical protein
MKPWLRILAVPEISVLLPSKPSGAATAHMHSSSRTALSVVSCHRTGSPGAEASWGALDQMHPESKNRKDLEQKRFGAHQSNLKLKREYGQRRYVFFKLKH